MAGKVGKPKGTIPITNQRIKNKISTAMNRMELQKRNANIVIDYANGMHYSLICEKYGISRQSIYTIIADNKEYCESIIQKFNSKRATLASEVGNAALEAITADKLKDSKAVELASIGRQMHEILSKQADQTIIINNNTGNSRDELLSFIKGETIINAEIVKPIDNTSTIDNNV